MQCLGSVEVDVYKFHKLLLLITVLIFLQCKTIYRLLVEGASVMLTYGITYKSMSLLFGTECEYVSLYAILPHTHLSALSCRKMCSSLSLALAIRLSSCVNLLCHSLQCCNRENLSGEQSSSTHCKLNTVSSFCTLFATSVYLQRER